MYSFPVQNTIACPCVSISTACLLQMSFHVNMLQGYDSEYTAVAAAERWGRSHLFDGSFEQYNGRLVAANLLTNTWSRRAMPSGCSVITAIHRRCAYDLHDGD